MNTPREVYEKIDHLKGDLLFLGIQMIRKGDAPRSLISKDTTVFIFKDIKTEHYFVHEQYQVIGFLRQFEGDTYDTAEYLKQSMKCHGRHDHCLPWLTKEDLK